MEEQTQETTQFNFALRFYIDLAELMNEKDRAYLSDEVGTYCKSIDRIYNRICFKVDQDDKDEEFFKTEFEKAKNMLYDEEERKETKKIIEILRQIDRKLIKLMDKYHMIFPKIDQKIGFDKVRSRYNIQG